MKKRDGNRKGRVRNSVYFVVSDSFYLPGGEKVVHADG